MDLYVLKMHKVFFFSTRNVLINALRISYNVFDLTHTHPQLLLYLPRPNYPPNPALCLSFSSSFKPNQVQFLLFRSPLSMEPALRVTCSGPTLSENWSSLLVFLVIAFYLRIPFVIVFVWKQS